MSLPTVFDFLEYKEYLNGLADSQPRGFKKKLSEWSGCQTAYISHVLNGHAHLSWEQAEAISSGIGHTIEEKEYFLLVVKYSMAGTPSLRKFIKTRLDKIRDSHLSIKERVKVKETLSREDQATYYSAWYFAAIHVMLTIHRFQSKDALSDYLKLSPKVVSETLDFLVSVGLAVKAGNKFLAGTTKIHLERESPLTSKHHTNWRIAAIKALENTSADEDLHYSSVFTLSEKDAQQVRSILVKAVENAFSVIKDSKEEMTSAIALDFFQI